jgi:ligand-binding sensor domain-containing protein
MMSRWRLTVLLAVLAASSPNAWGASATVSPPTLFTNTEYVEALAASGHSLWAATRGGVEEYDLRSLKRMRLLTTNDGLPANHVRGVSVEGDHLVASTAEQRCLLEKQRFTCTPAVLAPQTATAPELWQGTRVTASLTVDGRRFVGTPDRGVWMITGKAKRLTPTGQICGNHVMAVAEFAGLTWLGTFDQGLCTFDGRAFTAIPGPFQMINDLVATPYGLFVASNSGLFRSEDGKTFASVSLMSTRSINDLAFDGDTLWATSPAVLWQIPLEGDRNPHGYWQPGGTRSLQAVDVVAGQVWLASEDRGLMRKRGKQFQIFDRAAGLPSSWVVDVAAMPDGSAVAATLRDGLVRVTGKGAVTPLAGGPDAWLLHVSREDKGLWVGTQGGAGLVRGKKVESLAYLPNPCVHVVLHNEYGVWAGTEGGLAFYAQL